MEGNGKYNTSGYLWVGRRWDVERTYKWIQVIVIFYLLAPASGIYMRTKCRGSTGAKADWALLCQSVTSYHADFHLYDS